MREVGRNETRSYESGKEECKHALPAEQVREERRPYGDEFGSVDFENAHRTGVVPQIQDQGADQRVQETGKIEEGQKLRAAQLRESVTGEHEEA